MPAPRLSWGACGVATTPLQAVPPGPAKKSHGDTFLHPEVPSSDIDPGVGFETPEDDEQDRTPAEEEELACTQGGGKDRTETPEKESNAEPGDEDVRTPRREEPPEDISPHSSGGTWLSQVSCILKPAKYYWRKGLL
ncbi:hypothetical protein NDU88_004825 [Pleurodeles waltl]|uniref:Uncharacterized protein n=1 Tax=Pleurodeles waltl TaxID=8319 RepID=A0AAV7N452_PLEWA|nr:hypothetical protein NDU88_004825 [Pleurodeles waltl]